MLGAHELERERLMGDIVARDPFASKIVDLDSEAEREDEQKIPECVKGDFR